MNATSVPASGGIASSLSSHFGGAFMRHIWRLLPTRCFRRQRRSLRRSRNSSPRRVMPRVWIVGGGQRRLYRLITPWRVYPGHPRVKVHPDSRCGCPAQGRVRRCMFRSSRSEQPSRTGRRSAWFGYAPTTAELRIAIAREKTVLAEPAPPQPVASQPEKSASAIRIAPWCPSPSIVG